MSCAPFALSADLPRTLAFSGEFGAEVNSFIPFVYWLHLAGEMRERRIVTYDGMQPFYFFLDPSQIETRRKARGHVPAGQRPAWLPTRNDHASCRTAFEIFPDYRSRYQNRLFDFGKPLLVVHNKFTREWDQPPLNFLPLDTLSRIFSGLAPHFTIVYTRPGIRTKRADFSDDEQRDLRFDDLALVRDHPDVLLFEDVVAATTGEYSYNALKLMLYASAYFHLTVQGGNVHLAALFSGSLIGVLHRFGQEIRHAYAHGHFQYASNPRPDYLICRSGQELMLALDVFAASRLQNGRVLLPGDHADILAALSPLRQCGEERMDPGAWD
jgi:hypothetical protein